MYHRRSFAVLLAVALGGAALAQEPGAGPKTPPPEFAAVRFGAAENTLDVTRSAGANKSNKLRIVTEMVPVTKTVEVNGKKVAMVELVPVTRQVMDAGPVLWTATYRTADVQVFDLKGKRQSDKVLRKAILKDGTTPVLLASGAAGIDPFYARLFKEGTLVVVLPAPPPAVAVEIPKK